MHDDINHSHKAQVPENLLCFSLQPIFTVSMQSDLLCRSVHGISIHTSEECVCSQSQAQFGLWAVLLQMRPWGAVPHWAAKGALISMILYN